MSLGDKIRMLRNDKGISIRKLAELTGLSKSTLSDIENNVSKKPTIDTISKIAKVLQVTVSELLDEGEDGITETISDRRDIGEDTESVKQTGSDNRKASDVFLRSVARAKDHPKETQEKIAEFIELILDQEDNKRK